MITGSCPVPSKRARKHKRKRMHQEFISRRDDNGVRHYHCPDCVKEGKLVECSTGNDGYFNCKCGAKWTIVA